MVIIYLRLLLCCSGKQFYLHIILFKLGRISKQSWSLNDYCVKYINSDILCLETQKVSFYDIYSRGVQIPGVTGTKNFCIFIYLPNTCLQSVLWFASCHPCWRLEVWGGFVIFVHPWFIVLTISSSSLSQISSSSSPFDEIIISKVCLLITVSYRCKAAISRGQKGLISRPGQLSDIFFQMPCKSIQTSIKGQQTQCQSELDISGEMIGFLHRVMCRHWCQFQITYRQTCADKPTRCTDSYKWSLFFIVCLYMFRIITCPSSGAPSSKLYHAFGTFVQASLAATWL